MTRAIPVAYIGLKAFAGWQFTLTPAANDAGSPGFTRTTIVRYPAAFDSMRGSCDYYERLRPGYTERRRAEIEHPAPEWIEAEWLVQWERMGLVRKVGAA